MRLFPAPSRRNPAERHGLESKPIVDRRQERARNWIMSILSGLMNLVLRRQATVQAATVSPDDKPEKADESHNVVNEPALEALAEPVNMAVAPSLIADFSANTIEIGENITVIGEVRGRGNVIRIEGTRNPQRIVLRVYGNGNTVSIGKRSLMHNLLVEIGTKRWRSSRTRLQIGEYFSIGSKGRFILPNSGNVIEIGNQCMFSSSVQIRAGEYPHLIFDKESGAYLDESEGIFIGDHVWVGEEVFIAKAVSIPSECIVGARSVVTKRFTEENAVIAGNPARVVKRGVQWVSTEFMLDAAYPDLRLTFDKARISQINRAEALIRPDKPKTKSIEKANVSGGVSEI